MARQIQSRYQGKKCNFSDCFMHASGLNMPYASFAIQWTLASRLNLLDHPDHVTFHGKSPSLPMSTCGRMAIHSYAYGPAVYLLYLFLLLFSSVLFCSVLYHITILLDQVISYHITISPMISLFSKSVYVNVNLFICVFMSVCVCSPLLSECPVSFSMCIILYYITSICILNTSLCLISCRAS